MAREVPYVRITFDPTISAEMFQDVAIALKAVLDLGFRGIGVEGPVPSPGTYEVEVFGPGVNEINDRALTRWAWAKEDVYPAKPLRDSQLKG